MRFRLHGAALHVHRCLDHPEGCEYFADHAMSWMISNREEAVTQLVAFRISVAARIGALTLILASIDQMLARLRAIEVRLGAQ